MHSSCRPPSMSELIRDTVFGHFLRFVTRGKVLPYAEDKNPGLWREYVHHEMTGRMAHHGHVGEETGDETEEEKETRVEPQDSSQDTSRTRAGKGAGRNALGHTIDAEKGRDVSM